MTIRNNYSISSRRNNVADDPIKSIYSDEKQNLFLENDTIAQIYQAENAYNLDRSTPLSALKQMMREHYTPNTLMDNKTALAVVYRVEDQIPSFFEAIDGYDPSSKVQLLRIRVLSDPRNFWLPAAKNQDDPVISLHPMVRCDPDQVKDIAVGDMVKVEFNNNKSQFSTIADVGSVLKVVKRIQRPFDEPEINKKQTLLPALIPLPITDVGPSIDLPDTSAGKKGQALVNDRSFNQKVAKIAKRLGVPKAALLQIMAFETDLLEYTKSYDRMKSRLSCQIELKQKHNGILVNLLDDELL